MNTPPSSTNESFGLPVKLGVTLVLALLVAGGVYLVQRGIQSVEESISSRDRPTVTGEIVRSSVKLTESPIIQDGREVPNRTSKSYSPDIEYRYNVKGQDYTGTRVTVVDESVGTRASAAAIVEKFAPGKTVPVSYRPDQPAVSVLIPGSWAGSYRWFLPGGALLFIPLLLLKGIWFTDPNPSPSEVERDENHPQRAHLLKGMLMVEEIDCWEPTRLIHVRRARVGFLKSILAGIITGLILGLFFGLLPAFLFLTKYGVIAMAKFYLAVSAVLAVAFAIGLMLWGRRREYRLDWSLGTIHWEIGWGAQDAPLESIEQLMVNLPARDADRNPVVDSHTIQLQIAGKAYTILETNGKGLSWSDTRDKLVSLTRSLAEVLNVDWIENRDKSIKQAR
jgi:hypothetical protein